MAKCNKKRVDVYDLDDNLVGTYESVKEVSKSFGVAHANVLYWIHKECMRNGFTFRFHDESNQYYNLSNTSENELQEDVEIDRNVYKVIKYEVINGRVSITPCPFKLHPKPKVGSGLCMKCKSNKGRDRNTHEVACSHQIKIKSNNE